MKSILNIKTLTLALITLASVMFFTNPQKKDYQNYASEKLAGELQTSVCKKEDLDKDVLNFCQSNFVKGLISDNFLVKQLIDSNTEHQNFIILSIYNTKTPEKNFKTIGAFGNFITFPS